MQAATLCCACIHAGLCGATCRHEFPVVMLNLHTSESLAYYEIMLVHLMQLFPPEGDGGTRTIKFFLLDIACQLAPYMDRCADSWAAIMHVCSLPSHWV